MPFSTFNRRVGFLQAMKIRLQKAVSSSNGSKPCAQGLAAPIEVQRAQTTLSELEQQTALARQDWRTSSATLTRVLRLNPAAVIIPLEPPQLQVTIIPLNRGLGDLIPSALSNRPELASQQSLVKASFALESRKDASADPDFGGPGHVRIRALHWAADFTPRMSRRRIQPGQAAAIGMFKSSGNYKI